MGPRSPHPTMVDTDHWSKPPARSACPGHPPRRPKPHPSPVSSPKLEATPVEVPLISIQPCEDTDGTIQHALASLRDYHWLVFTSVNGVEIFFQRLHDFGLSERHAPEVAPSLPSAPPLPKPCSSVAYPSTSCPKSTSPPAFFGQWAVSTSTASAYSFLEPKKVAVTSHPAWKLWGQR